MIKTKIFSPIGILVLTTVLSYVFQKYWKDADNKFTDYLYTKSIQMGYGPPSSPQIIYLTITDNTYKKLFNKNYIDRTKLAECLKIINEYNPSGVILDLIFAFPSDSLSDLKLMRAISDYTKYYLPVAFALSKDSVPAQTVPVNIPKIYPVHNNKGRPFRATASLLQYDLFALSSRYSGHISDIFDSDDIFRNHTTVIKLGDGFIPSLPLAVYLDYMNVNPDSILIEWGNVLTIRSDPGNWLNKDIHIPINNEGQTFIPFPIKWPNDFLIISLENIYEYNENHKSEILRELIEGKFLIMGDISTGISDLASTTLNKKAPLITIQSAVLNALLNNLFYQRLSEDLVYLFTYSIVFLVFILFSLKNKKTWFIVVFFLVMLIPVLSAVFILFRIIVPAVTLMMPSVILFLGLSLKLLSDSLIEKRTIEEENRRRKNEFEEARKIQLSMLPKSIPDLRNFDISVYMKTATEVGGDYYDFKKNDDNSIHVILADATGHGLKAGVMVTIMKTLFTGLEKSESLLSFLTKSSINIKKLNLHLLFTCAMLLHIKNNFCMITSAGMPPALIYRSQSNSIDRILLKAMPLGSILNYPYQQTELKLGTGDIILIYSDGLSEMFSPSKQMFGEENIVKFLMENSSLSPNEIVIRVNKLVSEWTKAESPSDDVSVIVIKCKGED